MRGALARTVPARCGARPLRGLLVGACLWAAGCQNPNQGVDPPVGELFFPAGLLLDPRAGPPDPVRRAEPVRYLLVANGNNDLSFNAGSVLAIDVERFFSLWQDDEGRGVYPFCEADGGGNVRRDGDGQLVGRCVLDAGSETDADHPCRRLALSPQVVECDESPFVVDAVRIGDFATVMAASHRDRPRIWVPVRGGPAVTYINVNDGPDGTPDLECGQREDDDGFAADNERCSDEHRLTHARNDKGLTPLQREPFNIHVTETDDYRYAFVAHASGPAMTLIDLDGLRGVDTRPAIVDAVPLFQPAALSGVRPGGFGLATRPCSATANNVPSISQDCRRPLVYGSFRFQLALTSFTASGLEPEDLPPDGFQFCADPEQIGQPGAIPCEATVQASRRVLAGAVDPLATTSAAALGDLAFADPQGNELYVVQTNPGALLKLDTSLDADNEPLDVPAARPIEICAEPTRMKIWDGLAFVTCFRAAAVFVVDLLSFRVINTVITGTGPHDLVVDPGREVLYVANTLEASISVIDLDPQSRTRFREIGRIGLQEPFSQ